MRKTLTTAIHVLFISAVLALCGCRSNECGILYVSNDICKIGATVTGTKTGSHVLIGLPFWVDSDTKICGVAFSPLGLGMDELDGVSLSLLSLISNARGVQIGGACMSGGTDGVVIAPLSFVQGGNCLQWGVIASNGVGRGSSGVTAQVAIWNHADASAANGPKCQIGVINTDLSNREDDAPRNFQIGALNFAISGQDDIKVNKRFQFGIVNFYLDRVVGNKEKDFDLIQLGLLNYNVHAPIPWLPFFNFCPRK